MTAIRVTGGGFELPRHLRGAGRTLLYLRRHPLGSRPGAGGRRLLLGAVLSLVWIGLPLLAAVARLVWQLAEGERRQANRLLDAHLPPVPRPPRDAVLEATRATGQFWRALAMLLLKLPVALIALVLAPRRSRSRSRLLLLRRRLRRRGRPARRPMGAGAGRRARAVLLAFRRGRLDRAPDGIGRPAAPARPGTAAVRRAGEGPVREMLAERLGDR